MKEVSMCSRSDGNGVHDDRVAIADRSEPLRRELDEERTRTHRLPADFANFRRRVGRERDAARRDGPGRPAPTALGAGRPRTSPRLFMTALREADAEPIEAVGQPFDPTVHEAVGTILGDPADAGLIARETRRGWRLGGELLRPARVVVASAPGG
jgi:molecular chaperone GrpE